jgi:hypothetical protein
VYNTQAESGQYQLDVEELVISVNIKKITF